jgi:hypothetical protein
VNKDLFERNNGPARGPLLENVFCFCMMIQQRAPGTLKRTDEDAGNVRRYEGMQDKGNIRKESNRSLILK